MNVYIVNYVYKFVQGIVAHIYNPNTQEKRQEDSCEFRTHLASIKRSCIVRPFPKEQQLWKIIIGECE